VSANEQLGRAVIRLVVDGEHCVAHS